MPKCAFCNKKVKAILYQLRGFGPDSWMEKKEFEGPAKDIVAQYPHAIVSPRKPSTAPWKSHGVLNIICPHYDPKKCQ